MRHTVNGRSNFRLLSAYKSDETRHVKHNKTVVNNVHKSVIVKNQINVSNEPKMLMLQAILVITSHDISILN